MTDRELMEAAARAAGAHWTDYSDGTPDHWQILEDDWWVRWDPLEDDADALRLAVKLGIGVQCHVTDEVGYALADSGRASIAENIEKGDDPCATTRRVIVMAAASIGSAQ